jgi:hypothetical protein
MKLHFAIQILIQIILLRLFCESCKIKTVDNSTVYALCPGNYTINTANQTCILNGYELATIDNSINTTSFFQNMFNITTLLVAINSNNSNDTNLYNYSLCFLNLTNQPAEPQNKFDNSTNLLNAAKINYQAFKNYTDVLKKLFSLNYEFFLCDNYSNMSVNLESQASIESFNNLISSLKAYNLAELDIISFSIETAFNIIVSLPDDLKNVFGYLNDVIYRIRTTNDFIEPTNITKNLCRKFRDYIPDFNLASSVIPKSFYNTYAAFIQLNRTITMTSNILNRIDDILQVLLNYNVKIVYQKLSSCSLTYDSVNTSVFGIKNVFFAYNQNNYLIDVTQDNLLNCFYDIRYQLFLAEEYNKTIDPPANVTIQYVNRLYSLIIDLNVPLLSISSLFNETNARIWLNKIENSTESTTNTIVRIKEFMQTTAGFGNSKLNELIPKILNDSSQILQIACSYNQYNLKKSFNQSFFTSQKSDPASSLGAVYKVTNSTFDHGFISLAGVQLEKMVNAARDLNKYSIDFYTNTVDYKSTIINDTVYLNETEKLKTMIRNCQDEMLQTSYNLVFLSKTIVNISTNYYQCLINSSNSLIIIGNFDELLLKLENLTDRMDETKFKNDFFNLTSTLYDYINLITFENLTIISGYQEYFDSLKYNLKQSLNQTHNAISYVYVKPTTTHSVMTTTNGVWQEWQQWSHCILKRYRREINNQSVVMEEIHNVSCSGISKLVDKTSKRTN